MGYSMYSIQAAAEVEPPPAMFLAASDYLNFDHPSLVEIVLTHKDEDLTLTALRLHDYVRDNIRFGWTPRFYAMSASEVASTGVGYCNTKGTLFVALLRGAGIPARQRFVTINSDLLKPFLNLTQPYVDHSFTEVFLDGKWLAVDSYIPDSELYQKAQRKLELENSRMGYGVHIDGVNEWNGTEDAFSQYIASDASISSLEYGVFADTEAFYQAERRGESLAGLYRFLIPLGARFADRAVVGFVKEVP